MALIELNLEKPALKRTESAESSAKQPSLSLGTGKSKTTESSETSGKDTSTVEVPKGESVEEESSGGGMLRRITMLVATVGAIFAVRKWRSRRKQQSQTSDFEEEWETPHSE